MQINELRRTVTFFGNVLASVGARRYLLPPLARHESAAGEAIFGIPGGLEKKACERQIAKAKLAAPGKVSSGGRSCCKATRAVESEPSQEATLD